MTIYQGKETVGPPSDNNIKNRGTNSLSQQSHYRYLFFSCEPKENNVV